MTLVVRYPKVNYDGVRPHWARNIAFSQYQNATSLIPTPIEPWLIKILQRTLERLPADDAALREEVLGFIGQESQHFRQHRLFNKVLIAQGYPKLAEYEKQLTDELEGFLQTKSLKFLLAYADGFESLGAVAGGVWFEKSDGMLEGANPNAVALWKWHMAEEFEHREVCFNLYHAMFARGPWNAIRNGYFYRIYGTVFAMRHLNGFMKKMFAYMLNVDRQTMTDAEKLKLEADIAELKAFQKKNTLPQLLKVFLPWYNPARKPTPNGMYEYLRRFEPGGDLARPSRKVSEAVAA